MADFYFVTKAPGMPGITGNLVDGDGFPRADIDVHKVRSQRQRLAMLKTDHKNISAEAEKHLLIALAPREDNAASSSSDPNPSTQPEFKEPHDAASEPVPAEHQPKRQPFAEVDAVFPNSPAESAGVMLNDRIVSFGTISLRSFSTPALAMENLPALLQQKKNQSIEVIVERGTGDNSNMVTLSLTPTEWAGRGLLGCHVVRMNVEEEDERYRPDVTAATQVRGLPHTNV